MEAIQLRFLSYRVHKEMSADAADAAADAVADAVQRGRCSGRVGVTMTKPYYPPPPPRVHSYGGYNWEECLYVWN